MSKNSVRLTICGTECVVGTDDSESYVRSIAEEVQSCMQGLSHQNENASGAVIAMVAALSFCDDYHKANRTAETLREQIKSYLEDSSKAHLETEDAKKEAARLKQEVASLRARLGENDPDSSDSTVDAPVQRASCSGSFSRPKREDGSEEGAFLHYFEDEAEKEEPKNE